MRRECQIKNFDGLRRFSCVCRMIRFSERNTNEVEHEGSDFSSAYQESCVHDHHYVCVLHPERARGFPVEINLEEEENGAEGMNDDADENIFHEGDDDPSERSYTPSIEPSGGMIVSRQRRNQGM